MSGFRRIVMAGLDPAIPLTKARPGHGYRDRRVKPGDDGEWAIRACALQTGRILYSGSLDLAFD
jgi:hypothetical protein